MAKRTNSEMAALEMGEQAAVIDDNRFIMLNVGGIVYQTSTRVLRAKDGLLRRAFDEKPSCQLINDDMGRPFIDRNGKAFRYVLEYLRTGRFFSPEHDDVTVREIALEFSFYELPDYERGFRDINKSMDLEKRLKLLALPIFYEAVAAVRDKVRVIGTFAEKRDGYVVFDPNRDRVDVDLSKLLDSSSLSRQDWPLLLRTFVSEYNAMYAHDKSPVVTRMEMIDNENKIAMCFIKARECKWSEPVDQENA